ncbi:hypothetical protein IG206_00270 [Candidatus Parvarchaeota archaeon]|nr:hypothetical protein [Candidatus Acidifodinimicrobium mancum]
MDIEGEESKGQASALEELLKQTSFTKEIQEDIKILDRLAQKDNLFYGPGTISVNGVRSEDWPRYVLRHINEAAKYQTYENKYLQKFIHAAATVAKYTDDRALVGDVMRNILLHGASGYMFAEIYTAIADHTKYRSDMLPLFYVVDHPE